jgi:hypothetical protein
MHAAAMCAQVDSMRAQRGSLSHIMAQAHAAGSRKKAVIADFR